MAELPRIKQLGPYEILSLLGRGGMGTVYAGENESGNKVAIKVLGQAYACQSGFRSRFETEIETLRQLRHDHIVDLYGFGEQDGMLFYVMELVAGLNVEEMLALNKRFTWSQVAEVGRQLSQAVGHAHTRGIVHRDIKPANIMLADEQTAKLSDFGIARLWGQGGITVEGGLVGTANYMSPEQAAGKPATELSDIYSLGMVMYAMVAGRPPFVSKSLPEMLEMQRYADPPELLHMAPDTPVPMAKLIHRLLSKEPSERVPRASAIANRLNDVLEGWYQPGEMSVEGIEETRQNLMPIDDDGLVLIEAAGDSFPMAAPFKGLTEDGVEPTNSGSDSGKTDIFDGVTGDPLGGSTAMLPAINAFDSTQTEDDQEMLEINTDVDRTLVSDRHANETDGVTRPLTAAPGEDGRDTMEGDEGTRGNGADDVRLLETADEHTLDTVLNGHDTISIDTAGEAGPTYDLANFSHPGDSGGVPSGLAGMMVTEVDDRTPLSEAHDPMEGSRYTEVEPSEKPPEHYGYQNQSNRLASFFWTVVGLGLVALLGWLVWLTFAPPGADELHDQIMAAVQSGNEQQLLDVEETIDAMELRFPGDPRNADYVVLREQIEAIRFERQVKVRANIRSAAGTLIGSERAFVEAFALVDRDPGLALTRLKSLVALFDPSRGPADPLEPYLELARQHIQTLEDRESSAMIELSLVIMERIKTADQLSDEDPETARSMYEAIIVLYGNENWAVEHVTAAQDGLNALDKTDP